MKPRDQVLLAIGQEEPDRVPLDYWSTPEKILAMYDYAVKYGVYHIEVK